MEGVRTVKDLEERGLANKAGPWGCLPVSANESGTYTSPQVSMAKPNIPVQHTPLWALQRPLCIHKASQTSCGNSKKIGAQGCTLLGRPADHGRDQGGAWVHLATAMYLLTALGFILNLNKNVLTLAQGQATVLKLLQLLGSMIATHPAILAAPLYYWHLERAKITALKHSHNYNTVVRISEEMKQNLIWWLQKFTQNNGRSMQIMQWDMVIESDASMLGWGANFNNTSTGRPWTQIPPHQLLRATSSMASSQDHCQQHTQQGNSLEIRQYDNNGLPQQNGRHTFGKSLQPGSSYLEMVLGEKYLYPCGAPPWEAECQSRLPFTTHTRLQRLAVASSDFPTASRQTGPILNRPLCVSTNAQLPTYCSWKLDPTAVAIDALSISWRNHYPYLFPPFSLLSHCLEKINQEKVEQWW